MNDLVIIMDTLWKSKNSSGSWGYNQDSRMGVHTKIKKYMQRVSVKTGIKREGDE